MRNFAKMFSILSVVLISSGCKKDTKNPGTPCQVNCDYWYTLTQHKWTMIHHYEDSAQAALVNPLILPLSTTYDYLVPYDTCAYDSRIWYNPNGEVWSFQGTKCGTPADTTVILTWKLKGSNNDELYFGGGMMNIIQVTSDTLKLRYLSDHTAPSGQVTYYTNIWVFKQND